MTNLTPEQRVLGRENAEPGPRRDPPRLAQGRRRRAGPGRLLLRLQGDGRQAAGQGRDHRHRQRRLPGDDPLAQPRLPRLHRLLRHPAVAAGAGRQGVLATTRSTRPADVKKLKQYDDQEEMLADPDVEMVVIALPLWLHAPVAIEAMKAGKHVFSRS